MKSIQTIDQHQLSDGSYARVTKLGRYYNFNHYGGELDMPEVVSLISKPEAMRMLANTLRDDVLEIDN